MKRDFCLIISGSPECFLPPVCRDASCIIACDYGGMHALRHGIRPDLWVGDFDSCDPGILPDVPRVTAPKEKDDTDTMMALKEAMARGYRRVVITGALGARMDHAFANLQLLIFAEEHGIRCRILDRHHQIFVLKNTGCRLRRKHWRYVSVFAVSDRCEGVTLQGLKYPLRDGVLHSGIPLGVSNEFSEQNAQISVQNGTLLIILCDRK